MNFPKSKKPSDPKEVDKRAAEEFAKGSTSSWKNSVTQHPGRGERADGDELRQEVREHRKSDKAD